MLLADAVFRSLGRCSAQEYLLNVLAQTGVNLSRNASGSAAGESRYPIAVPEHGIVLVMESVPVVDSENLLGLHSVCISTNFWSGPWFKGIDPKTVSPQEITDLLAVDSSEALVTPEMACFTVHGLDGVVA